MPSPLIACTAVPLVSALLWGLAPLSPEPSGLPGVQQDDQQDAGPTLPATEAALAELQAAFQAAGVRVDREAGAMAFPVAVEVRNELLEYLLVMPHGAAHEALFMTEAPAEVLNAALLSLGLERGTNVQYVEKNPPPSEEELRAGVRAFDVVTPVGDGVFLYATWKEGDDTYFYRVEDLVRDLKRSRTMRRHRWVFLGSRMVESRQAGGVVFAAAAEGNLACISFFSIGNTLLTAALPECTNQTSWLPNAWLLPESGTEVLLVASREELLATPESMQDAVPLVASEADPAGEDDGR